MQSLNWERIFSDMRPLAGASRSAGSDLMAALPEFPIVPLDQVGVWTSTGDVAAEIHVIAGTTFARLGSSGVVLVEPRVFRDHRGYFLESYHREKFHQAGIREDFVQDNHSLSKKHVLRGLHYQIQQAQGKLIRCVRGEVFDVAVDLRRSSPYFGLWFGTLLSAENQRMMYLPPGFAHGFCTHSDDAEVVYKCTDLYAPEYERTLIWNDPKVAIPWPVAEPILADKDSQGKTLDQADCFD